MNKLDDILDQWKGRITPARKEMLSYLVHEQRPVSANELLEHLKSKGFTTNKTTVYRALSAFCKNNLLKEITSVGDSVYYEFASLPHHHHLVCEKCGVMKEVHSEQVEESLSQVQTRAKQSGFVVKSHTLEFFGLCAGCM